MRKHKLLAALILAISANAFAAEKGYFGIGVSINADGFINPTIKSLTVKSVAPNSPAAKAGVVAGDLVVEVEGKIISGLKADELKPYMQRNVGESTRFVFKRVSGEVRPMTLVAGPKSE